MNKFLTFLATGFIAILSVFSVNSNTKNSAEPQYFLKNKEIKNAAVENSTETNNIIDFYFDSKTNLYGETEETYDFLVLNENTEIYYYNENDTLVNLNYTHENTLRLSFETLVIPLETSAKQVSFSAHNIQIIKFDFDYNEQGLTVEKNQWYVVIDNYNYIKTKGFRVINFEYYDNQNLVTINTLIEKYIGNLKELEQPPTPTNSLDQIGNIISDTIDWFVNIFSGLSNVFYNNGTLSVWGNVLFIGVAIYLVSICLIWVISLIKGV